MHYTQRHPYYVNYVCDYLWTDNESMPKNEQVKKVWFDIIEEECSNLLKEYFSVPETQKKLLRYIALNAGKNIYTAESSRQMELATTSVPAALNGLLVKDLVESFGNKQYQAINPLFKWLLAE
jgi:hypothetical protein